MQGQFRPGQRSYPDISSPDMGNQTMMGNVQPPVAASQSFAPLSPVSFGNGAVPQQNAMNMMNNQSATNGTYTAYAAHTKQPTSPIATPQKTSTQRKKSILVASIVLALLLVLGVVVGVVRFLSKASADVTLYQAGTQNVTQYVGGGGVVYPHQQLVVSYPTAEQAVNVLVKPGDTVSANQAIIQLDPTQINIQIKQASDDVNAAQAYLDSVSTSGTAVAIAQAQQQYDVAKSRYNALVAQYSSLTVHGGNLVATMAGVVTEVDVNPGEVFAANAPLLTIMDESTEIVHVKVPLSNLNQVHVGQAAQVTPSALPDVILKGQVSSIIPQADPQTDTFEVWVSVTAPGKNLLPGMSAFVQIQNNSSAIVVPRLAVVNPDRDSAVFVCQGNQVSLRRVTIVGRGVDDYYVGQGLSPRDEVVLVGVYELHDGQKVHVVGVERAR